MNQNPNKNSAYLSPSNDVLEVLGTREQGLSEQEAAARLEKFGYNDLKQLKKDYTIFKFFRQFKDFMIILLIISSLLSIYLGDYRTAIILSAIVLLNTIIGFIQEFKAEKIMDSLKALVVSEAKVYRNGKLQVVGAATLVPGDIIYIEEGDFVPADGRIFEESELATNDFALTGESNPSRKFTHAISGATSVGNRRNLVFMGTTVATGNAKCAVIATGMETELGRIANLSQSTKPGLSPLQLEMNNLAARITVATLILAAILVAISLGAHLSIKDAFIFAIGIASAMIPQGLPAEVNTSLAQAANKLARARALVKKLSAVETLGATSVICTDKTGTLTKNEMTVEHITLIDQHFAVSGSGYETNGQIHHDNGIALNSKELKNLHLFFVAGFFASNAKINPPDEHHNSWYCLGDPTEGALITLTKKAGIDTKVLDETCPELKEFPFDSARKRMSSVRSYEGKLSVFVKGAPEMVLEKCTHILAKGKIRLITDTDRKFIAKQNDMYANKAMRNLAYAYKELSPKTDYKIHNPDIVENNLVYLGLVSMIDPVRPDVVEAMVAAREAHIKVSIITGDYAPTAKATALRAKLADRPEDIVIVGGDELTSMKDNQVLELVLKGGIIFSRVSPEDKLRIVNLIRSANKVVAVTGDGINDAPALKRADIGVAMGRIGTDVAKQSADIVLLDDSFHTLVGAIQQGRGVFQNIKKATLSCLTSNSGELIVVLTGLAAASLYGIPAAISVVLILAVDLIAELFPIAALGWDTPEKALMKEPPRQVNVHIFNRPAIIDLLITGLLMGSLAYANFLLFASRNGITAQEYKSNPKLYAAAITLTYVTIVSCQLINILIRRSQFFTISKYMFTNYHLWLAFALSLFCVLNIVYNPWIQRIFNSADLSATDWLYVFAAAGIFFIARETIKLTYRRLAR
jgi:Ca2+-transporting ATPase